MSGLGLIVLGVVGLGYALVASRLERRSLGGPLVFTVTGLALGPSGLGLIDLPASSHTVETVTEMTLALLLFADASTIGVGELRRHAGLPLRLLVIGLPLTILLGVGLAYWVLAGVTWAVAALVATILAPTDAALGLPVVTNPQVPTVVRTTLNVESGLNDGMVTPLITVLLAVIVAEESADQAWVPAAVVAIAVALAVAAVLGAGVGWLASQARERGWTTPLSDQLIVLVLASLSYLASVALDGNGFVASFVAGLLFGVVSQHRLTHPTEYTETTGLFLSYTVWVLFGAVLAGPLLDGGWNGSALVYAVLSLTVIRMLPVALALLGTGATRASILFLGWFGPRGLASVVFLILAAHELQLGVQDTNTSQAVEAVIWTILLSVVLHGLSAGPLSARYGRIESGFDRHEGSAATAQAPLRRRLGLSSPDSNTQGRGPGSQ